MKKKKILLILLFILLCFPLGGCWNYKELNNLDIAAGGAIDYDPLSQNFTLSGEVFDQQDTAKIITASRKTLIGAAREISSVAGKTVYWSHAQTFVLGQDFAKSGCSPAIEWIFRSAEPLLTTHLVVSKLENGNDIFSLPAMDADGNAPNNVSAKSFDISAMLKTGKNLSEVPVLPAYKVFSILSDSDRQLLLPAVTAVKSNQGEIIAVDGSAVFKKDQLLGFLSKQDTKYLMFALDLVENGILEVPCQNQMMGYKIMSNKTKVRFLKSDDSIVFRISLHPKLVLSEAAGQVSYMEDDFLPLEASIDAYLSNQVTQVIQKIQNEFQSDVLGFGLKIKNEDTDLWKEIGGNWENEFPKIKVELTTHSKILNAGGII